MSDISYKTHINGMVFEPGRYDSIALEEGVRLARGKLHEVCGEGAIGFVASLIGLLDGPVIWVACKDQPAELNPEGLAQFFDPGRLILVKHAGSVSAARMRVIRRPGRLPKARMASMGAGVSVIPTE